MRVPLQVVGRTQRSGMPIAEASSQGITPDAFGAGIGRAVEGLGLDIQKVQGALKAKNDQTAKFQAMQGLTQFETQVSQSLQDAKRTADPTGKGFLSQANETFAREEENFLNSSVPPEMREEFKVRTGEIRQKVVADSLNFEYAAGDAHYKQGIADTLSQAQTNIAKDPSSTDAWRKRIAETVDSTDLPTIEKENIKRQANISLLKTEYVTGIRDTQINSVTQPGGVAGSFVNKIIGAESGGNRHAKNPTSSAEGLGQFIDSTWVGMMRKYHPEIGGSNDDLIALKTDATLGREMTQRYAEENQAKMSAAGIVPTEGGLYLMHFLGPAGGLAALRADPNAPVRSVVPAGSVNANQSVFAGMTTVGDLIAWSNKKMGSAPGATAAVTDIMTNPRYDAIPYEDKILMQNDALQQAQAQITATAKQAQAQQEAQFNTLLNGLNDGTVGATAIDAARQAGWLTDYDQINKAQDVYKQRNESVDLAGQGYAKMGTGGIFDPTDDKDKKMLNAMVGKDGLTALSESDTSYVTNSLLPIVSKTQDIPTDVMGTLSGMIRSNNQSQALFALDALAQLRETSPKAFDARTDEKLAGDIDFYNARKGLYPADELMRLINPNVSQAERQVQDSLRKEATDILMTKKGGVPAIRTIAEAVVGDLGGELSAKPGAINALEAEFGTLFTDAYTRYGNAGEATKAATEQLKRTWGETEVGSGQLMKFPPEQVGYKPLLGSYNWINDQVRNELRLPEGSKFELYSDEQTEREFNQWKTGGPSASYRVVAFDDKGVPREVRTDKGQIARLNFKPPEYLKEKEVKLYDLKAEERAQAQVITDYANARHQAAMTGQKIPPELEAQYEAATRRKDEVQQEQKRVIEERFSNEPLPEVNAGGSM